MFHENLETLWNKSGKKKEKQIKKENRFLKKKKKKKYKNWKRKFRQIKKDKRKSTVQNDYCDEMRRKEGKKCNSKTKYARWTFMTNLIIYNIFLRNFKYLYALQISTARMM